MAIKHHLTPKSRDITKRAMPRAILSGSRLWWHCHFCKGSRLFRSRHLLTLGLLLFLHQRRIFRQLSSRRSVVHPSSVLVVGEASLLRDQSDVASSPHHLLHHSHRLTAFSMLSDLFAWCPLSCPGHAPCRQALSTIQHFITPRIIGILTSRHLSTPRVVWHLSTPGFVWLDLTFVF